LRATFRKLLRKAELEALKIVRGMLEQNDFNARKTFQANIAFQVKDRGADKQLHWQLSELLAHYVKPMTRSMDQ